MLRLLDLPHHDARALASRGAPVFLLVNPVEYHGPHLSLHNDHLLSVGLARELHARLQAVHPEWPFIVASDLEVGVEPTPGAGTRHLPFTSVRAVVLEAVRALQELGAQRVIFMTFHGAPLHSLAIEAGAQWLRDHGVRAVNPFNVVLREMLHFQDPGQYAPALDHLPAEQAATMLRELNLDFHAGFFETSLALHLAPDSVGALHRQLPPCPRLVPDEKMLWAARTAELLGQAQLAGELRFAAHALAWRALRPFPGYTGAPSLATAEAGRFFTGVILDKYLPVVRAVLEDGAPSPGPIMPWVEPLSLGGRLGQAPLPTPAELLVPSA